MPEQAAADKAAGDRSAHSGAARGGSWIANMAAVAYAAAAWPSGARPVPLPARRPFGGRLLTSQGVAQGWHVMRRPASPSGDRPGGSGGSGGGSDPPPTSSDGGGGASGGSWGASVLGVIAKHPSEALTCIVTSITGGYVFMWWRELKSVRAQGGA